MYSLKYLEVLGQPLFKLLGGAALACFLLAAAVPLLNRRGFRLPFRAHSALAWSGLAFALAHFLLALLG